MFVFLFMFGLMFNIGLFGMIVLKIALEVIWIYIFFFIKLVYVCGIKIHVLNSFNIKLRHEEMLVLRKIILGHTVSFAVDFFLVDCDEALHD